MRLLLILLLLTGCRTYQNIQITYLPEIEVPDDVKRIVVVDRVNPDERTVLPMHFGEAVEFGGSFHRMEAASCFVTDGLVESLSGKNWIRIANDQHIMMSYDGSTMPDSFIDSLCSEFNADAVLVLEKLSINHSHTSFKPLPSTTGLQSNYSRNVQITAQWNLILPDGGEVLFGEYRTDHFRRMIPTGYREQPSDLKAAETAALINFGNRIADRLNPKHILETRLLYTNGNQELWRAYRQAHTGNWKTANATWKRLFEGHPNERIRRKALNNLVVGAEAEKNFEAAMVYAKILQNRYGVKQMEEHYNFLFNRNLDYLKIKERRTN